MENKKIIKCFIASPGDTTEERNICDDIFSEINHGIGRTCNFEIQSLKWENDVYPDLGEDGQDVINKQMANCYDLFIGIMYTRFGTPTKRSESGTVEEFWNAYERAMQKDSNLGIMLYFNDEPISPSMIDTEQFEKVKKFREEVSQMLFFRQYNGIEDFTKKLRNDLQNYFIKTFSETKEKGNQADKISVLLKDRLDKSLQLFSGQPKIWIEPVISSEKAISINPDENYDKKVDIDEIINNPDSIIISAPPQFGLTCLSHYMVYKAWEKGKLWIRIDANKIKSYNAAKCIDNEFEQLEIDKSMHMECIVMDTWHPYENGALKKLKSLCDNYKDIPIIVMRTLDDSKFLKNKQEDVRIERNFHTWFLLAMTRNQIRTVVTSYNKKAQIADDDELLNKVIQDLSVLNIHRTPQNCLTLLKVDEKKFDKSPVNRCQMLEDILYILFDLTDIPRYDSKPDVKDCQFVLGCFCEKLLIDKRSSFTKEEFIQKTRECSSSNLISIDIGMVLDILMQNNIITEIDGFLTFKSAFWFLYFIARRMEQNSDFANYIFTSKIYMDYPEIIEFYTGTTRNKDNAIKVLLSDIKETCDIVCNRLLIPNTINPYRLAHWCPNSEHIKKMQEDLGKTVRESGLPDSIKDRYQDQGYNQLSPYKQNVDIHEFFEEYYVYNLMQEIKSSSRALRNSDYVDAEMKKDMLNAILHGWLQVSKVLFALLPVLATKGVAEYGGAGFILAGNFGDTEEERAKKILLVIPKNVVGFFKDDIFSSKISPLLYNAFDCPNEPLIKHELALLLVTCRPPKWYKYVEQYIVSLQKDSFFLFNLLNEMSAQYDYGFVEETDYVNLRRLMQKCLAKHEFGVKNPSPGQMKKILLPNMSKTENVNNS